MVFKIGSADTGDYSNRVISGSYNVQTNPIYNSWTDANGTEHRLVVRQARTMGTFDMFFKDMTEYNAFVSAIASARLANMTVLCSVLSNTTDTVVTGYFFIDFAPIRDRRGDWNDYMKRFTVTITEA